jgi:hypothetical protein
MIHRNSCIAVSSVLVLCGLVAAKEVTSLKSGVQVGGLVAPFQVKDITGDQKGKDTLCYVCRYGNSPVVAVFVRSLNEKTAKLISQIDQIVAAKKGDGLKSFVVYVADDTDGVESKLAKLASEKKISVTPLTVFKGAEGPEDYELSRNADVTVMMWVESAVKVNHAIAPGKLDDKLISAIGKDVQKIMAK